MNKKTTNEATIKDICPEISQAIRDEFDNMTKEMDYQPEMEIENETELWKAVMHEITTDATLMKVSDLLGRAVNIERTNVFSGDALDDGSVKMTPLQADERNAHKGQLVDKAVQVIAEAVRQD